MADLYRKYVIHYKPKEGAKFKRGGQIGFLVEMGGLRTVFATNQPYLEKGKSKIVQLLNLAIPGLVDDDNPDALHLWEIKGTKVDHALVTPTSSKGGIDLNDVKLNRGGSGLDIRYNDKAMQEIIDQNPTRFTPVIINIQPVKSIYPLLGLKSSEEEKSTLSSLN